MEYLAQLKCGLCHRDDPPSSEAETSALRSQVPNWEVVIIDGVPQLKRASIFKNFAQALAFTNLVGMIAEEQDFIEHW